MGLSLQTARLTVKEADLERMLAEDNGVIFFEYVDLNNFYYGR